MYYGILGEGNESNDHAWKLLLKAILAFRGNLLDHFLMSYSYMKHIDDLLPKHYWG